MNDGELEVDGSEGGAKQQFFFLAQAGVKVWVGTFL